MAIKQRLGLSNIEIKYDEYSMKLNELGFRVKIERGIRDSGQSLTIYKQNNVYICD